MNREEMKLDKLLDEILSNNIIEISDIPNIDLYIDQITTFIEKNMSSYKRHADDKLLTKTMINNYTKDKVLPRPDRKKYSKEHMILLIIIYHLKPIISLSDINAIINNKNIKMDVSQIYKNFTRLQELEKESLRPHINEMVENIEQDGMDTDSKLILLLLSLIIDANAKKQLAEKIIDGFLRADELKKEEQKKEGQASL